MKLLVAILVGFCTQNHGLLNKDQCLDWVKDCYIFIRPAYDDDHNPMYKCMSLYKEIYYEELIND